MPTPPPMHSARPGSINSVGMPERPGDVLDGVARLQRHQLARALAHGLNDQRDRAGGGVGIGDGQRDALGAGRPTHDDELAGLADFGDARAPRRPAG